jgi:hypothetical protein
MDEVARSRREAPSAALSESETADRVESLFATVCSLASAADRAAYLDKACAGNAPMRAKVAALLRDHEQAAHRLRRPAAEETAPPVPYVPPSELPGTLIAERYKLLEVVGAGGMGTVWVAEQTVPVRRKVALKLIKPGMDSRLVLARFEAERQALALMDHPLDIGMPHGFDAVCRRCERGWRAVRSSPVDDDLCRGAGMGGIG